MKSRSRSEPCGLLDISSPKLRKLNPLSSEFRLLKVQVKKMFVNLDYSFRMPEIRATASQLLDMVDEITPSYASSSSRGEDNTRWCDGKLGMIGRSDLLKLLNEKIVGLCIPESAGIPSLKEIREVDSSMVPSWAWDAAESRWMNDPRFVSSGRSYHQSSITGLVTPKVDPITREMLDADFTQSDGQSVSNWNLKMAIDYWLTDQTGFTIAEIEATKLAEAKNTVVNAIAKYRELGIRLDSRLITRREADTVVAAISSSTKSQLQLKDIMEQLLEASTVLPKDVGISRLIAMGYVHLGASDDAMRAYRKCLTLKPKDVILTVEWARVTALSGKEADRYQAVTELKNCVTSLETADAIDTAATEADNHKMAICYCEMGRLLNLLSQQDKSIKNYTDAVRLKPDYLEALVSLADNYSNMKSYMQALQYIDRVIKLLANDRETSRHDTYDNLFRRCSYLYHLGLYSACIEECDKLILDCSKDPQGYVGAMIDNYCYLLARSLEALNRFDQAIDMYLRVAKSDPKNPSSWHRMGDICYKIKRFEDAIGYYTKAIAAEEDMYRNDSKQLSRSTALPNRAKIYLELRRYRESKADYLQYLKRQTSSSSDRFREEQDALGEIYFHLADYASAHFYLNKPDRFKLSSSKRKGASSRDKAKMFVLSVIRSNDQSLQNEISLTQLSSLISKITDTDPDWSEILLYRSKMLSDLGYEELAAKDKDLASKTSKAADSTNSVSRTELTTS